MPSLFDPFLTQSLYHDKEFLEKTQVPMVTVSAASKEDAKRLHHLPNDEITRDLVFSRAHFSMALGVAIQAWTTDGVAPKSAVSPAVLRLTSASKSANNKVANHPKPEKAWLVDPANYVSRRQLLSLNFTEAVGKTIARHPILKTIKDLLDRFGRQKMPILGSITPPLLYLTQKITRPILSFHIAAGNILLDQGKTIVQVITDPHVRDEYVRHAANPRAIFCTFDEATKLEFLEIAALHGLNPNPERVVVTGPPVDPRIVAARHLKQPWRSGALKLCLTTGGLGTNRDELLQLLDQLLPELRKKPASLQLLVYTGTHSDIHRKVLDLAKKNRLSISDIDDKNAKLRVLYHPQLFDANELLIKYAFPWADGFITKPSGDMAYDAVASGSFLLTLQEWGEWELRIREIFEQKEVARRARCDSIVAQLQLLQDTQGKSQSWIERAMLNATRIDKLFLNGSKNILKSYNSCTISQK
jgi:hypothetical protein